ncbi:MAG: NADH:flavin oxidoreductase/NADH oxidase [Chloroflexi bacterium]|nr:NADH:flavin oxidoreductase/NADH oxidase [Chloroflexota bacterium]
MFESIGLRSVTLRNRIVVSPMCQESAIDGIPNDWHLVHLGSRAVGGAGLVLAEATAVEARGRITLGCTGLWSDAHTEAWAPIARFIREHGAVAGVQLAHAGRKASVRRPWEGGKPLTAEEGAWQTVSASAVPLDEGWHTPAALSVAGIRDVVAAWRSAAERALAAGFQAIEMLLAHGFLAHQFYSPYANQRDDAYGGSFDNRVRFALEIATAVRSVWPDHLPLIARLSSTDWEPGYWDLEQTVELARRLGVVGVDVIDASSGGNIAKVRGPLRPAYQTPFAERIKRETGMATMAVGLITSPELAEEIVSNGRADLVAIGRELLRDPYWPLHAARSLGADVNWPVQYARARLA